MVTIVPMIFSLKYLHLFLPVFLSSLCHNFLQLWISFWYLAFPFMLVWFPNTALGVIDPWFDHFCDSILFCFVLLPVLSHFTLLRMHLLKRVLLAYWTPFVHILAFLSLSAYFASLSSSCNAIFLPGQIQTSHSNLILIRSSRLD